MADPTDKDAKPFAPFSDEQRALLEEKVRRAKEKLQTETQQSPKQAVEQQSVGVTRDKNDLESTQASTQSPPEPTTKAEVKTPLADFVAIDVQQRDLLRHKVEARLQTKLLFQKLRKRLLSMSGKQVTIDEHFPYNEALLERGQTWSSLEAAVITGPDVNAQRSVAKLWQRSSAFYSIAVGYALDAAGTWRKHVWLLAGHKVQEVTLKYAVYYGIKLTEKESKEFVRAVLG